MMETQWQGVRRTLGTGLVWALLGLATGMAQELPPTLVVTDAVTRQEFFDQVRLVGRTQAWNESRVVAEVAGRVAEIQAQEGTWVAVGTPLLTIDAERIRLDLTAKAAEVRQAELQAELARTHLERTQDLFDRSLVSQTSLDSARAWAAIQQERHRQLDAERSRLVLDLDNGIVRAPFAGYTGARLVDAGEWVTQGTPVFELVDLSRIRVIADLPERYFGHVEVGRTARVARTGEEDQTWEGRVTGIAARASDETHTFPVTVTVADAGGQLGGGMLVRVVLSLTDRFSSLAVSKDAIVRQGSQTLVYTVRDGKAAPIPVVTSSTDGSVVAVTSEMLTEGMPVVVRGNERVFPGSPVQVAGAPPPGETQSQGEDQTP